MLFGQCWVNKGCHEMLWNLGDSLAQVYSYRPHKVFHDSQQCLIYFHSTPFHVCQNLNNDTSMTLHWAYRNTDMISWNWHHQWKAKLKKIFCSFFRNDIHHMMNTKQGCSIWSIIRLWVHCISSQCCASWNLVSHIVKQPSFMIRNIWCGLIGTDRNLMSVSLRKTTRDFLCFKRVTVDN